MLKIGMSACFMYPDLKRKNFGPKTLLYMGYDMSHYLGRSGIMPILIPDLPEDQNFFEFLDQLDGVIFQGGIDINPMAYGETAGHKDWEGDPKRDQYEMKILKYAIDKRMPVMGICRGMQLINVFFGGDLYQDIPSMKKGAISHQDEKLYDNLTHKIVFEKGGLFERLYPGEGEMLVNSVHHQAIRKLGDELVVEAKCPEDGIIEAISWKNPNHPEDEARVFGLQWHPEFFSTMKKNMIDEKPTLNFFMKKCLDYRDNIKI